MTVRRDLHSLARDGKLERVHGGAVHSAHEPGFSQIEVERFDVKDRLGAAAASLVEDGQTVVIGGVYEFTDRSDVSKVPFLGDIPFLGNLFKKKGRLKDKAELLIFITPKVLRVAGPAPVPGPRPEETVYPQRVPRG
jgi:Flp pilus assembly secretin CpaC